MPDVKEFGCSLATLQQYEDRISVSHGLAFMEPTAALDLGYIADRDKLSIVPTSAPRPATAEQLEAIAADSNTERIVGIYRVPRSIGLAVLNSCFDRTIAFDSTAEHREIAPGLRGLPMAYRADDGDQLTTSVDATYKDYRGDPLKVGAHIDKWPDPNLSIVAFNLGPGSRYHILAPDFNRDVVGGGTRRERQQFLMNHPDPDSIPVYWFRLDPPGKQNGVSYCEAIGPSPVSWALHDGSTIGFPDTSLFCCCAVKPDLSLGGLSMRSFR